MQSVLKETRERMKKSLEAFEQNIASVRTGRANPAMVQRLIIDYYGATMPLSQLASISSPDPRTLVITPFDKSIIALIEKSIRESELGFNPNNQGDSIFITVPPLNDQRRRDLVKNVKTMAEDGKIALRNVRRDAIDELDMMEQENMLTEDDVRLGGVEVQKITDEYVKIIEERIKSKEADIMEV